MGKNASVAINLLLLLRQFVIVIVIVAVCYCYCYCHGGGIIERGRRMQECLRCHQRSVSITTRHFVIVIPSIISSNNINNQHFFKHNLIVTHYVGFLYGWMLRDATASKDRTVGPYCPPWPLWVKCIICALADYLPTYTCVVKSIISLGLDF